MGASDRAFASVLLGSAGTGAIIALPLVFTLFPGYAQEALHGSDGFVRLCAAAVSRLGAYLPPLGLLVLALSALAVGLALVRALGILRRTARLAALRLEVSPPPQVALAAVRVGLSDRLSCFAHPDAIAYTAGLLRPRIWLSTGLSERLAPDALAAVLWHERAHLVARDPLRVLIARSVAALFFVVPWVGALVERYEIAKELDADREALRRMGTPAPLAQALCALGDRNAEPAALAIGAWSLSGLRIDQLNGARPQELLPGLSRGAVLRSLVAMTLALGLTLGQAARANAHHAGPGERTGGAGDDVAAHVCPLPHPGILL